MADLGILGLSRGAPALTSLDLTGCISVTDAGVAHLASLAGHRLESLRLDGLPELSDDGLDALCPATGGGQFADASPLPEARLRLLSVAGCVGVTDAGLALVGESCLGMTLTELDVSATSVTEKGLVRLAAAVGGGGGAGGGGGRRGAGGGGARLKRIVLPAHGRGVSEVGLGALVSMTALTWLDLEGCSAPGVTSQALAGNTSRYYLIL